jgi:hypothetical protein
MNDPEHTFDRTTYEIRLKGHIDDTWKELLGEFTFTHEIDGTTTMIGDIIDQSALHSVLKKIRDLGIPLLSVKSLETGSSTRADFDS